MQPIITDCRVYERHLCQVPTSVQPAASNEVRWETTIENISQSGLRLRLKRRFEPRTALAVELPGRPGQDAYTVYVKVVHVRALGDSFYALGCHFMSELSEDELQRLLALGDAHGDTANTKPERLVVVNVRLSIKAGAGRYVRCRARRLHVGGAWPMPAGATLNLRGVAADGSRLEQEFAVVACERDKEGWELRVRPVDFASVPDWLQQRAP